MADLRDCPELRADAATSMAEVIDRLTGLRDCTAKIAPHCGIAQFSDLYLTITQTIWDHIQAGGYFADDAYLARLDVAFANRYFDALRGWAGGARAPRAWRAGGTCGGAWSWAAGGAPSTSTWTSSARPGCSARRCTPAGRA